MILILLIPWALFVYLSGILIGDREILKALVISVAVGIVLWWLFVISGTAFFSLANGKLPSGGWRAQLSGWARVFGANFRLILLFLIPVSLAGIGTRRAIAWMFGG